MTVMYSFCLWFPVRLGAIIVGLCCLVESFILLIAAIVGINDVVGTSRNIDNWLQKIDFWKANDFFINMKHDPTSYLSAIIAALSIHLNVCVLLVIGAFKCSLWLIYPFVGLEFLRLLTFSGILITILIIIKVNTLTLGTVIACSICGGFLLLYLWYQWFCVVSLCQVIREVQKMDQLQITPLTYPSTITKKMNMPVYPQYTGQFYTTFSRHGDSNSFFGLPKPT